MNVITSDDLKNFISENIQSFHSRRLQSLQTLKLKNVLLRKNPYLFKAKNINTAETFVKTILDAHLSSQEEGIFGSFLEQLAKFVCEKVYSGKKSSAEGIDLEFEKEGIRYLLAIKSGPNWSNSQQISRLRDNFKKAKKILQTNTGLMNVVAVNGCCYGKDNCDKGDYLKICGKEFWALISGDDNMFIDIIKPLEHKAKQKNELFYESYSVVINNFTEEFIRDFCDKGKINWEKIVRLNSEKGYKIL
ncbi:MAG: cytosolic protein [Ignavibacteriae bacterium]|nr:MAG: cytosolic protein [Ignavibacteriota bacterium]